MNNKEILTLSEEIEQFMYDRGEYDYSGNDRIRWLFSTNRNLNIDNIKGEIINNQSGAIIDYLNGEISTMDDSDDLIEIAEYLISKLNTMEE